MSETSKPRLVGINHIAIEVGDIEQALDFYGKIFDFTLRNKRPGNAFIELGDQFINMMQTADPHEDRRRHFEIDLLSLAEQRPGIFGASGAPHVYSLACHRGADRKVPERRAVRSLTVQIIRKFPRNKANKHHRIS